MKWSDVKDILFPIFCLECGVEGSWWCERCQSKKVFVAKRTELNFLAVPVFKAVTAFFNYDSEGIESELIQQFKYGYAVDIVEIWRNIIDTLDSRLFLFDWSKEVVCVPVPLHPRRLRERGFNQAEIIAGLLVDKLKKDGKKVRLEKVDFLRKKYTKQQARLSKEERLKNVEGAFMWNGENLLEQVILIDDVFTTGATMLECVKQIELAGAKHIEGLVLGKGQAFPNVAESVGINKFPVGAGV